MSATSPSGLSRRCLAALLALLLAGAPPALHAQVENLPRLGDAGGEELSPAAERRLGETIMRDLRRDPDVSDDVEVSEYLNRLGAQLSAGPSANGFSFELFLVRDATLNAFALPGGFIGVHSGLIVAAQSESELASVVAHEIGHVTQRHIARMLAQQRQTSMMTLAAAILGALAARSNPAAMAGIVTMAGGAQQQQMLSFSRDAEREADRVGLETLRQAGFEPRGMVSFFQRLQQSSRLYESAAPGYMRSHPVTAERIADLQSRVQDSRYRQLPDSIDFRLMRAKLRVVGSQGVDGLREVRAQFERQLRDKTTNDELATWYGLAVAALAQRDYPGASQALQQARQRHPAGHPAFERLGAETLLRAGDAPAALALAQAGAGRFAGARALVHLQAEALLAMREDARAVAFLTEQLALYRTEPRLWRLLARAHGALNQPELAHRATAEEYALSGSWLAAVEQLRLALRSGALDFFTGSLVDARMKEFQAAYQREKKETTR